MEIKELTSEESAYISDLATGVLETHALSECPELLARQEKTQGTGRLTIAPIPNSDGTPPQLYVICNASKCWPQDETKNNHTSPCKLTRGTYRALTKVEQIGLGLKS